MTPVRRSRPSEEAELSEEQAEAKLRRDAAAYLRGELAAASAEAQEMETLRRVSAGVVARGGSRVFASRRGAIKATQKRTRQLERQRCPFLKTKV